MALVGTINRERMDLARVASTVHGLSLSHSSPGNVRPVREVAGTEIYQSYIGSSANPGYRDFAVAAEATSPRDLEPLPRTVLARLSAAYGLILASLTTMTLVGVTVAVDSAETIAAAVSGGVREVLIDVNVGLPRCGCA